MVALRIDRNPTEMEFLRPKHHVQGYDDGVRAVFLSPAGKVFEMKLFPAGVRMLVLPLLISNRLILPVTQDGERGRGRHVRKQASKRENLYSYLA